MTAAVRSGMAPPMLDRSPRPAAVQPPPLRIGFVVLVASLMALGAIGVDTMLPALPAIGRRLGVDADNQRQFVISIYLIGLGTGQLLHGPLADRFGRRPVMIAALLAYAVANLLAAAAGSFFLLLAARLAGGIAVSATRVVTIAIVRDRFAGRAMARVMSLAFIVFMIAPVLAPTLGQIILSLGWLVPALAPWRLIFAVIALLTMVVLGRFASAMPESLAPEGRMPLTMARWRSGWAQTLGDRASLGYTLASTALQGALFGYITSVQQIVAEIFHSAGSLNIVFALTAGMMALSNLINSRLVMRLGSRFLSHGALVAMIVIALINLIARLAGTETLVTFVALQAATMGCYGLASANFSAMAMEDMGSIAGTASSIQGFISLTAGSLIGMAIGQAYAGTTIPLHLGFVACGLVALTIVAATERGRLFRPQVAA